MSLADLLLAEHTDIQACAGCGGHLIPAETPGAYWSDEAGGWVHGERCEEAQ